MEGYDIGIQAFILCTHTMSCYLDDDSLIKMQYNIEFYYISFNNRKNADMT